MNIIGRLTKGVQDALFNVFKNIVEDAFAYG